MGKRLFVGNLPYEAEEADLRKAVEGKGYVVEDVTIVNDRETGKSRGFGFVTIDDDRSGEAIGDLDGTVVLGRTLRVNEAHERERDRRQRAKQGGGGRPRTEPEDGPLLPSSQALDEDGGGGRRKTKRDKKRRRQRRDEKEADW